MIQKPTIRLTKTLKPQRLYTENSKLIYAPFNIKKGSEHGVIPQHMHSILHKTIKPGDAYYDEIDQSVHICTHNTLGMVHSAETAIIEIHAFYIVGSTDAALGVFAMNEAYIKLYCESGGEIDAPEDVITSDIKIKIQALLIRGMNAASQHGVIIGGYQVSDLSVKYAPETSDNFINNWISKNFIL